MEEEMEEVKEIKENGIRSNPVLAEQGNRPNSTEAQYEAELQEIKARTMYNLIEEVTVGSVKKRLLLLTNRQASLFNKKSVQKLLDAFEIPHKPKLVIKLVHSELGINQLKRYRSEHEVVMKGNHDIRDDFMYDNYLWTPPGPTYTEDEVEQGENRLCQFFRDVLVPLCAQTNAIVLAGCSDWDVMSAAFSRAVNLQKSSWGSEKPFTTIGFGYHFCFHLSTEMEGTMANDLSNASNFWAKKRDVIERFLQSRWGDRSNWLKQDIVSDFDDYILFDAIKIDNKGNIEDVEDTSPSSALENMILGHFTESLPCICFRTTRSNAVVTNQVCTDILNSGTPMVFLDLRERPLVAEATRGERLQKAMEYIVKYRTGLMENNQNDPYDNCNLAWLQSILSGYDGADVKDAVSIDRTSECIHEAINRRVTEGKRGKVGDGDRLHDILSIADFLTDELCQNFWQREQIMQRLGYKPQFEDYGSLKVFYREMRTTYHSITREMLVNGNFYGRNVSDFSGLRLLIQKLIRMERIPLENSMEGLMILRQAWDTIDICTYISFKYKWVAKIGYFLLLLIAVASTGVTVLKERVDQCIGFTACQHDGRTKVSIFLFSLSASVIGSIMAYLNPVTRWRSLRNIASRIESTIWMYRARVGPFAMTPGIVDAAEMALRSRLLSLRNEILTSADVTETAFMREYSPGIFLHGQREGTKKRKKRPSNVLMPEGNSQDNHQSPVTPQLFIDLRVQEMIAFYRKRLPAYRNQYNIYQLLIILSSATAALLSSFDMPQVAAIVVSFSACVVSWMEFHGTRQKLERYNKSLMNLVNIVTWYESMSAVEKASLENITMLVMQVETAIIGENNSWLSVPSAQKDDAKRDEEKDQKEKEK
uniref:SMODS and SLOG-associating 2TM effector domain-containing protein n=1 Tax=Hanusia phi TaxID=3032 RepID=A0A7S0ECB3_9CRYP|mmetsp:Transcript_21370/g.48286  ORF Transcript_21370/g.48286 Transcript_21370/m.48286 type:complete len:876 (+) Transcript_21370:15-2642(+)